MPSRCSRRSAAAFSVGLAVGLTTAPSRAFVAGWVAPAGQLRVGRGIVRQRSSPVGSPSTSCRCGGVSSATSESGHEWKEVENNPTIIGDQDRLRSFWRGEHEGVEGLKQAGISMLAGLFIMAGGAGGGGVAAAVADGSLVEPTSSVTVQDLQRYDGFEDYAAQGQQMENSDVGCFANECKKETASCFTDGSCLKGVTCLGRCKGEQACATRCFAQYGSGKLDSWLTCTLEDHSCVKIPKDMDFSAINKDPPHIVKGFDAKQLQGTWYKVMGVNKKYDCFDCQKNTFSVAQVGDASPALGEGEGGEGSSGQVADIKVNFRLAKPDSDDFWENTITERLQVDPLGSPRTFHTDGKLFGLSFKENWYVTGQSTDPGAEFVFVQYKGHTLQGSYDGGFVYARKPYLPPAALAKVSRVAREHGIDPDAMLPIDNTCAVRTSLPRAGDTTDMNALERFKYEASFVYDLMEWVHPGTIHKYASADQNKHEKSAQTVAATTVANAGSGGVSSSLKAGPINGDDG